MREGLADPDATYRSPYHHNRFWLARVEYSKECQVLQANMATDNALFDDTLLKYFDGQPDQLTLDILAQHNMAMG